jgi:Fumarylacetoacetate (FAA) hydrolase family
VVIGTRCRRVPEERALEVVAGYTIANDITMRDYQNRTHHWLQGKAWHRSTPLGPVLVTPDEVGDPSALTLRTIVNGEIVQEASTDLMIFPIARLISTISKFATLEPGDLILTGTPAGVGFRRDPALLLGDGDIVAVEIGGVGRIENRVCAEVGVGAAGAPEPEHRAAIEVNAALAWLQALLGGIALAGGMLAALIGRLLASRVLRPVVSLSNAVKLVRRGTHPSTHRLPPASTHRRLKVVGAGHPGGTIALHPRADPSPARLCPTASGDCSPVSAEEVDEYLRGLDEPTCSTLQALRCTFLEIVPDAKQAISYRVPCSA